MADQQQQTPASDKGAAAANAAAGEGLEGATQGESEQQGTTQTDLQKRAQLDRQFAAFTRKQKEFEHRSKTEREKFESERKAFEAERQKHAQEIQALNNARHDANSWMAAGGFNYDQITQAQLQNAGTAGNQNNPQWKALEERLDAQDKTISEQKRQLLEWQNNAEKSKHVAQIGKLREAAKEQFELCNHFADDENIDEEVYSYIIKHNEKYGETLTYNEALAAIEEYLEGAVETRAKKFLASPKIASRVGWKDPKQENQPGETEESAEPPVQQTSRPARGKQQQQQQRAGGKQRPVFKDLPLDPEKRMEAMKAQLSRRA